MMYITVTVLQVTQANHPLWNTDLFVAAVSGRRTGSASFCSIRTTTSGSAASSRSRKRACNMRTVLAAGFCFLNSNFRGLDLMNQQTLQGGLASWCFACLNLFKANPPTCHNTIFLSRHQRGSEVTAAISHWTRSFVGLVLLINIFVLFYL